MNTPLILSPIKVIVYPEKTLTPGEEVSSRIFSAIQKARLQNEIALITQSIASLEFDPADYIRYAQNLAWSQGQLAILQSLLDESDSTEKNLISSSSHIEE